MKLKACVDVTKLEVSKDFAEKIQLATGQIGNILECVMCMYSRLKTNIGLHDSKLETSTVSTPTEESISSDQHCGEQSQQRQLNELSSDMNSRSASIILHGLSEV